jgi:hypothetical protein
MTSSAGTKISYLYRDASNYKFRKEIVLIGSVVESDVRSLLIDGEYFVPRALRLLSAVPQKAKADDHDLHEIECFLSLASAKGASLSARLFMSRLRYANEKGWFHG